MEDGDEPSRLEIDVAPATDNLLDLVRDHHDLLEADAWVYQEVRQQSRPGYCKIPFDEPG